MAISEKKLKQIKLGLDKTNKMILNLYKKSGDKALLEMLYLDSEDPREVAEEFDIPLDVAEELVEKDKALKAEYLKESDSEADEDNDDENLEDEDSDDTDEDACDDSVFEFTGLSDLPEKIIEAVCFIGELIQDTSEKICDVLDESVERMQEHDFDF